MARQSAPRSFQATAPGPGFWGAMASSLSDLEKRGADLGLTREEVTQALSLGRPTQDLACFEQEKCLFLGVHGPSSDGYYDYFVNRDMGPENGLYHVCDCEASRCRVRKARGDRSELIHVDRWRLQTPATMMESPYLAHLGADLGEKALSTAAREKKAAVPIGSGLDAALLGEAGPGGEEMEVDKRSRKRSRSPRGEQGSMGRYLTQQAVKQGETKAASQKKKKRSSPKRKKRRKGKALAPARRRVSPQVFNWPQPGGASCGGPLKRNSGG